MATIGDEESSKRLVPVLTYIFILLNVLVFTLECVHPSVYDFFKHWGVVPSKPEGWGTLLSAPFIHVGWMHFLSNITLLWMLGDELENALGRRMYALFFLECALAAGIGESVVPPSTHPPIMGASGVIAGFIVGHLMLFGRTRIRVYLGEAVAIGPLWGLAGLWFLTQFFTSIGSLVGEDHRGELAYGAYVGAILGAWMVMLVTRGMARRPVKDITVRRDYSFPDF